MKNASEQLSNIFKSINKVKKTLRSKKYCYEDCKSEEIRKMFLIVLQSDLFLLRSSLDDWIGAGCPMGSSAQTVESRLQISAELNAMKTMDLNHIMNSF